MPVCYSYDKTKIYYKQQGNRVDNFGLIFLSGISGDHTAWQAVIDHLPKNILKVTIDNRGAGQSDSPDNPYHTEMMAKDTLAVMQAAQIDQAIILGHSMGGAIAQALAVVEPKKVLGLVLAGSFLKLKTLPSKVLQARAKLMESTLDLNAKIELNLPWLYSDKFLANEQNVEFAKNRVLKNPFPQPINGFQNQLHACLQHDLRKQARQIMQPTLILSSLSDLLVSHLHSEEMSGLIPNSILKTLTDSGHMFILEEPAKTAEYIKQLYNNLGNLN